MTSFIYNSDQTVWVFVVIRTVSLLAVFFRVILVDVTCKASYCRYTWTDYMYKTGTEIAKELNITPVLDKM